MVVVRGRAEPGGQEAVAIGRVEQVTRVLMGLWQVCVRTMIIGSQLTCCQQRTGEQYIRWEQGVRQAVRGSSVALVEL